MVDIDPFVSNSFRLFSYTPYACTSMKSHCVFRLVFRERCMMTMTYLCNDRNTEIEWITILDKVHTQCQHLIPALNAWTARHNIRPHAQLPSVHGCMDELKTERSFDSKPMCHKCDLYFDVLSIGVCTTRPWQTSV